MVHRNAVEVKERLPVLAPGQLSDELPEAGFRAPADVDS